MSVDLGKLILRAMLGILILLHGIAKLRGGIDFITHSVTAAGLPGWFAYAVYAGEVLAPLLVIAGWHARIGAALIAVNMLFAFGLVHQGELFSLAKSGGWALELQGMFLAGALGVALIGPGRYSLNGR
ncbi:MAG: DoxX family protein [Steroidobacteraceae bacterium]